ncbi:hypothetical protein M011DRAFT_242259 [Sporormia fimetaria CBS 119925]|uniref:Uncharacterized protein n=1 Tax=Sporormia fimetaria CBS 119925 TaxID=1340428 RepID=A0A6A6VLJ0_9PLEO|nr:hypothetical protein M011DRAFT_242259 [Sporormia fimetaria CBS 119925]
MMRVPWVAGGRSRRPCGRRLPTMGRNDTGVCGDANRKTVREIQQKKNRSRTAASRIQACAAVCTKRVNSGERQRHADEKSRELQHPKCGVGTGRSLYLKTLQTGTRSHIMGNIISWITKPTWPQWSLRVVPLRRGFAYLSLRIGLKSRWKLHRATSILVLGWLGDFN